MDNNTLYILSHFELKETQLRKSKKNKISTKYIDGYPQFRRFRHFER